MTDQEFLNLLSAPRNKRFLEATDHDEAKAVELYREGIVLSSKYFALIGLFEVFLRNKVDEHYSHKFVNQTDKWVIWLGQSGSLFDNDKCRGQFNNIQSCLAKDAKCRTDHYQSLSNISFGFWTGLFKYNPFYALGSNLMNVFTRLDKGVLRRDVSNKLVLIKELRNRIAHQEPIIFRDKKSEVYLKKLMVETRAMTDITRWLDIDPEVYRSFIEDIKAQEVRVNTLVGCQ